MFRSDRILTLDVGASRVVLAEFMVARSRPIELLNYGIGKLDMSAEAEADPSAFIVTAIREVMRDHSIRAAPLLMSLSGQSVFPRFVKLPPVTKDKLLQIVRYEAEQNVPFPIEEVVWDYQLIGEAEGELNVMLVAVKIENVQKMTECVVAVGMEPEVVDVAPMALYNAVRYNYPDLEGCTMVLDVGARASNLIFIEGNRIFSRSIPVAGNAITQEIAKDFNVTFAEAEELKISQGFVAFGGVIAGPESEMADRVSKIVRNVVTRLHAEVNRSINFYRSQQGGSAPTAVLLTGGSSAIPHLDTFFKDKLKVSVEILNPFLKVTASERLDADALANDLRYLGEGVGLALRRSLTCPVEINLMPPDLVAKKVFRKRQPYFALMAVGVALIMLCWWVFLHHMRELSKSKFEMVEKRITRLQKDNAMLQTTLEEEAKARARITQITDVVELRTAWIQILDEIHGCMLDGMWLTGLKPGVDPSGQITQIEISGKGFADKFSGKADLTAIEEFRNRLRKSRAFTEKTEIREQPNRVPYLKEFTITAPLKTPMKIR